MSILFGCVGAECFYIPKFMMRHWKQETLLRDEVKIPLLMDEDYNAANQLLRLESESIPGSQSYILVSIASFISQLIPTIPILTRMTMTRTILEIMILHCSPKD